MSRPRPKVRYWMQVIKADGKRLTPVIKQTEAGQSAYASKMYRKYGDGMQIERYHFDENLNRVVDETWG